MPKLSFDSRAGCLLRAVREVPLMTDYVLTKRKILR